MQNNTSTPYTPSVFSPPPYAVAVNILFFASLGIVLLTAFLCMLVKGWIRELDRKLQGIPDSEKRAVIKELREQGLARWRLPEMIIILPPLIYISLTLFSIGLAIYLSQVHRPLAYFSIFIFGVGVSVYTLSIAVSIIDDFSPFRNVYSRALGVRYRRLYRRLSLHLIPALVSCSALPQTTFERIRERISILIIKYRPLSEKAILDPQSSSSQQIISKTSISIFNKIWSSARRGDTSAYAKDISISILLQLDVPHIRPSRHQHFPLHYELSKPSIEGAEGLAYSVCMMRPTSINRGFVGAIRAGVVTLRQSSDFWHHLVASLTNVWVEDAERELSAKPFRAYLQLGQLSIAGHKEDILYAISNIKMFSAEQWCFVLGSIYALFVLARSHLDSKETRALTEVLVGLLDKGLHHRPYSPNEHTDFWLYVMMLVLNKGRPVQHAAGVSELTLAEGVTLAEVPTLAEVLLVEQDISVYGNGMTRNPENFRQLLQLSQKHKLDQSLMRRCLISILYILVSFRPRNQQQLRLIDQYMEIIKEEMDVVDWNLHLSVLLTKQYLWPWHISRTVLCLLEGRFPRAVHVYNGSEASVAIMRMYDGELSQANKQPTSSILKVMSRVIFKLPEVIEFKLRNPWLALHALNITKSPFHFDIPSMCPPYCTTIASSRLDLYDRGVVQPEMDLITVFLSCPDPSTACRALRRYLCLKGNAENTLTGGDMQHLTVMFPIIFRKGLDTDDKLTTWLLLVDILLPRLDGMPPQEKGYFVEAFFGNGSWRGKNQADQDQSMMPSRAGDEDIPGAVDVPTATAALQADGLGWMEDVWVTDLQPLVVPPGPSWPKPATLVRSGPPESAQLTEPTPPTPEMARMEAPEGTISNNEPVEGLQRPTEHLAESARSVIKVLAQLLDWRTGSLPAELLDRIENSPLLSEKRLQDDAGSLHHIKAILKQEAINATSTEPSHASSLILNPGT